jgi:hypothetical protein
LRRSDYGQVIFTDAQWEQMRKTFPNGVCDYSKRAVGQQHSIPWMTYEDGPGGKPLGAAPESVPSAAPVTVDFPALAVSSSHTCASRRTVKLRIRAKRGTRVRSSTFYVDGHRVKAVRGARKRVSLSFRGRRRGTVRVLVKIKAVRKGRRVTLRSRHTYRLCTAKKPTAKKRPTKKKPVR